MGDVAPDPADIYMGIKGSNGRRCYLFHPRPEDFDPEDSARSLSCEARYAGNYGHYSVAQHEVLVARTIEKANGYPPQVLAGLHHDDSEMVTGDLPSPLKRALRVVTSAFDDIEAALEHAIETRYQIDFSDPIVKWADEVVFHWEVQYIIPADARWMYKTKGDGGLILPATWFVPWSPAEAALRYLETHNNCVRYIENHKVSEGFLANAS
jgi:hypothetical protein